MSAPPAAGARGSPARYRARLPLMALAVVALASAMWGGLLRLGWSLPAGASAAAFHGPLIVSGFLGTVIGLERAVALGRPWAYAAPLAAGLGALALLAGNPPLGAMLLTASSAGLLAMLVAILERQTTLFVAVMSVGAAAWLVGQVLWLAGWPIHRVVLWWIGFLVLTIAGERLELSRLVPVSPLGRSMFPAAAAMLLAGLVLSVLRAGAGAHVTGAGLLAIALWLARYDVARRTVRQPGLSRFVALCLLAGYFWLGAAGCLGMLGGLVPAGPRYDALLHMVFLGFVFSMIFGHAPIIFPAVLGWRVAFRPSFYAHLALLHASLVLRIAGDLLSSPDARRWGGLLNVAAVLLLFANTAYSIVRPRA